MAAAAPRVIVNDRALFRRVSGVGRYLSEVLAHWPSDAAKPRGLVLPAGLGALGPHRAALPRVEKLRTLNTVSLQDGLLSRGYGRAGGRRRSGGRGLLSRAARSGLASRVRRAVGTAALYWEPDHIPHGPARRTVTTIHDLSVLDHPQYHPEDRVEFWGARFHERLGWSDAFVCPSDATADRLRRELRSRGLERRVESIPLGPRWGSAPADWTGEACRRALGLTRPYVACIGTIEPRKNHRVLLDALELTRGTGVRLVLAGGFGWGGDAFFDELLNHPAAERVRWAGHIDDPHLAALLKGSIGHAYPSWYEGFGLPALEAMALGVPSLVSTAASLREVAGVGMPTLPPDDPAVWAASLDRLATDPAWRGELSRSGEERAAAFSWKACSEQHAALVGDLLQQRPDAPG
ncbi:MAG: glycosyltransferase family 1 protein [Planctomycetota bacterium]